MSKAFKNDLHSDYIEENEAKIQPINSRPRTFRNFIRLFRLPNFGSCHVPARVAATTPPTIFTAENGDKNGTLNDDITNPTFYKFIKGKDPTLADIIAYEGIYKKTDEEITHTQRKISEELGSDKGSDVKFEGFGWIAGVLIRCMLCIFGATLFLRMSWTAGQAGIALGMAVIILSLVVAGITAISMSAIATNGEVRNGGLYYLVSRSLGPEFGGSIGIIFYVANIINGSMNCVGLAETIKDILKEHDMKFIDGDINDVRIYGLATCIILQGIIFIGTEFESKTQMGLLVTVIASLITHIVGSLLPLSTKQRNRGIVGYNAHVFWENMFPDFRGTESFITVFGVYFPAMTGIMGGANMSGDLKDPSKSIPKGTLLAIVITTITYAMSMLITAATTVRDATGHSPPVFDDYKHQFVSPPCRLNNSCAYGLANDFQIVTLQGAWSPLIIAGIIATTLSSASGCLIGAPRVFQALCEDKLYPYISYFAKGHGKNNDPFRAYFLTCFIACAVICIGNLNDIAMIITNFFLAAFAITNFATFDASAAKSPGFRPGFKWYNKYLSLFGSILCIVLMFVFSWIVALGTLIIFAVLFYFIKFNKARINWGSSTEANRYRKALIGVLKLTRSAEHVKNYRPQILVLTGNPAARQVMVDFAYCITKGTSLLMCGHIIPYPSTVSATACIRKLSDRFVDWFDEHRVKAFYCAVAQTTLRTGVQSLLQTVGLGKMTPNILMIGYKDKWLEKTRQGYMAEIEDYLGVINDAFESNLSVCIFRNENEGLDHSAMITSETDRLFLKLPDLMLSDKTSALADDLSSGAIPKNVRPKATSTDRKTAKKLESRSLRHIKSLKSIKSEKNINAALSQVFETSTAPLKRSQSENFLVTSTTVNIKRNMKFRSRVKDGIVDVWWLFDDGGLTLLLPYLLTNHQSFVEDAKLRVFTICPPMVSPEIVQGNLEKMLKKFRINFKQVTVIVDVQRELYVETKDEYDEMIHALNPDDGTHQIPQTLLENYAPRTHKILLQREYLLEHSSASNLVIITLPLAPADVVNSPLYMLWLDMLSHEMPPTLFVRGNHTSVLTFYS